MSISFHPGEGLLMDYASGAMGEAWGLAVASHLTLCPTCRGVNSRLESLGGCLLDSIEPGTMTSGCLEAVLSRLDETIDDPSATKPAMTGSMNTPILPQPLRGYAGGDVDDLEWQRLGLGAYHLPIATNDDAAFARLLRIPAGRPVPQHTHQGLELTLVLDGSFSDVTGRYARGDLQEADETLEHQPHADTGVDCICLAVTDAPLRFSSLAARLVQKVIDI